MASRFWTADGLEKFDRKSLHYRAQEINHRVYPIVIQSQIVINMDCPRTVCSKFGLTPGYRAALFTRSTSFLRFDPKVVKKGQPQRQEP